MQWYSFLGIKGVLEIPGTLLHIFTSRLIKVINTSECLWIVNSYSSKLNLHPLSYRWVQQLFLGSDKFGKILTYPEKYDFSYQFPWFFLSFLNVCNSYYHVPFSNNITFYVEIKFVSCKRCMLFTEWPPSAVLYLDLVNTFLCLYFMLRHNKIFRKYSSEE